MNPPLMRSVIVVVAGLTRLGKPSDHLLSNKKDMISYDHVSLKSTPLGCRTFRFWSLLYTLSLRLIMTILKYLKVIDRLITGDYLQIISQI